MPRAECPDLRLPLSADAGELWPVTGQGCRCVSGSGGERWSSCTLLALLERSARPTRVCSTDLMITPPALRCLLGTVLEGGWPLTVEMVNVSAATLYRLSRADLQFEGQLPKSFPWPCRMASAHVVAGIRESVMQLVANGPRAELMTERPVVVGRDHGPLA